MEIRGEHCLVRPYRRGDAPALARHANNRAIWLNLRDRFPHPYTPADAEAYIRAVANHRPPTSFVVEVDGEPEGGVSLRRGEDIARLSAEIGYWMGEAFWGRGIATEAVRLVTAYSFGELDLLRTFALPFARNPASLRVLEKAGYEREGLLRRSAIKAGEVLDQYLYAALAP